MTATAPNGNRELNDPQTRQSAVIAMPFVLRHLRTSGYSNLAKDDQKSLNQTRQLSLKMVCDCLEEASVDSQFDRRGDVGSWVRESSIEVIAYMLETFPASDNPDNMNGVLSTSQVLRLFNCILRQAADKFDRTRGRAGFLAYRLIHHSYENVRVDNATENDMDDVNTPKSSAKAIQRIQPEWLFRRAYYSFPYEILCGRVRRSTDVKIDEHRNNNNNNLFEIATQRKL